MLITAAFEPQYAAVRVNYNQLHGLNSSKADCLLL
jgi:hypothetical protein